MLRLTSAAHLFQQPFIRFSVSLEAKDARRANPFEMALKSVNGLLQSHGPGKSLRRWRDMAHDFANSFVHVNDHVHLANRRTSHASR
jgi:hypothetical protein